MPHYTMEPKPAFATGWETHKRNLRSEKKSAFMCAALQTRLFTIIGNISQWFIILFFVIPEKIARQREIHGIRETRKGKDGGLPPHPK